MLALIDNDLHKYLALAVMLLAVLFAYRKGRHAVSANGRSLAWINVPLIAFAIVSLGPSALAILIYLGYKIGVIQPGPSGYRFSTFIGGLPLDFAVMNWGFVAVYVACRLQPNAGGTRLAMWLSVTAMSLPNILLFSLAPTMVANVFDAGQGIGIIEATLIFPVAALFWPSAFPDIFDAGYGIGLVVSTLTAPIPVLGFAGWLVGQLFGRTAAKFPRKETLRS